MMKSWKKNMKTKHEEIRACPGWLIATAGAIFGALVCGVGLALSVTFWLKSTSTTSTMSTSSKTSVTTPFVASWNTAGNTVAGVTQTMGSASHLLGYSYNLAVDTSNNIYVVDETYHRVQKWTIGGNNGTTVAGQANGVCSSALNFCVLQVMLYWMVVETCTFSMEEIIVSFFGLLVAVQELLLLAPPVGYLFLLESIRMIFFVVVVEGVSGSANNQFWGPLAMARDASSGTLYISDSNNHRVMRYLSGASSGTVVAGGNGAGSSNNQLMKPRGVFYDASTNSLLIANNQGHNIVRWVIGASSWNLVAGSSVGTIGSTSTLLSYPTDVVLDSRGNMYVSDEGNHRIQFFPSAQANGTTVAGVTGISGSTAQLFQTPSSVTVDSQFNIYVTDYSNFRVQRFLH